MQLEIKLKYKTKGGKKKFDLCIFERPWFGTYLCYNSVFLFVQWW
jgi:hypothetical protein